MKVGESARGLPALGVFAAVAACAVGAASFAGLAFSEALGRLPAERHGGSASMLRAPWPGIEADAARSASAKAGQLLCPVLAVEAAGPRGEPLALYGVDDSFEALFPGFDAPEGSWAVASEGALAALGLGLEDELSVRLRVPDAQAAELPLAGRPKLASVLFDIRGTVRRVSGGAFDPIGLKGDAVFASLAYLSAKLGAEGRANLVLSSLSPSDADRALAAAWGPGAGALTVEPVEGGAVIRGASFFLPEAAIDAALGASQAQGTDSGASLLLGYFAESLEGPGGVSRFLFLGADSGGGLPVPGPGGLILSSWAAAEAGGRIGDIVRLKLPSPRGFASGSRFAELTVEGIFEPSLKPPFDRAAARFPGVEGKASCSAWESGSDLDLSLVTPRDEAYWSAWGALPKAYLRHEELAGLAEGHRATAIFVPGGPDAATKLVAESIGPALEGFAFASSPRYEAPYDLGAIVLASAFLVLAASFAAVAAAMAGFLESRREAAGLLLCLGFKKGAAGWRLSLPAIASIALGCAAGSLAGYPASLILIEAFKGPWRDASSLVPFAPSLSMATLALSFVASFLPSCLVAALRLPRLLSRDAFALVRGSPECEVVDGKRAKKEFVALGAGLTAWVASYAALSPQEGSVGAFLSGAALLALLVAAPLPLLEAFRASKRRHGMVMRSLAYQPSRFVLSSMLSAFGLYAAVAIGANPRILAKAAAGPLSGTGGFELYAEAPLGFRAEDLEGLEGPLLPLRMRSGDDLSCRAPGRAVDPLVIGLDPVRASGRFAFSRAAPGFDLADGWGILDAEAGPAGAIPCVADATSLEWNLGIGVGGIVRLRDESGVERVLVVAASIESSILQAGLIVSERRFAELFPREKGYRALLAEGIKPAELESHIPLARIVSADAALDRYAALERAYLDIFYALSLVGLGFGAAGLAARGARFRADHAWREALLAALGFSHLSARSSSIAGLALPLAWGLAAALIAAWQAVGPKGLWASAIGPALALIGIGSCFASFAFLRGNGMRAWEALKGE